MNHHNDLSVFLNETCHPTDLGRQCGNSVVDRKDDDDGFNFFLGLGPDFDHQFVNHTS